MNLEYLRKSRGFTEEDVARVTGINRSTLSLLANGHRQPTRSHMLALHRLFGPELTWDLEEPFRVEGVPDMPVPVFTNQGKPDFTHNADLSHDELRTKLQELLMGDVAIDKKAGESAFVVEVFDEDFVYEVQLAGGVKMYRQPFKVSKDGEVSLSGDAREVTKRVEYTENFATNTKVIYLLQDALRVRFPDQGCIVVQLLDEGSFVFVDEVGGLYSLGYTLSGKDVILSDEQPVPVVTSKRTLNRAIRQAKVREGQGVPKPLS